MKITEREKIMIKEALKNGAITEEHLLNAGYDEREIQDVLSDKEWRYLYGNIDDKNTVKACQKAVADILGDDWKDNVDYSEGRKSGKYELMLLITEADFNEICETARKIKNTL